MACGQADFDVINPKQVTTSTPSAWIAYTAQLVTQRNCGVPASAAVCTSKTPAGLSARTPGFVLLAGRSWRLLGAGVLWSLTTPAARCCCSTHTASERGRPAGGQRRGGGGAVQHSGAFSTGSSRCVGGAGGLGKRLWEATGCWWLVANHVHARVESRARQLHNANILLFCLYVFLLLYCCCCCCCTAVAGSTKCTTCQPTTACCLRCQQLAWQTSNSVPSTSCCCSVAHSSSHSQHHHHHCCHNTQPTPLPPALSHLTASQQEQQQQQSLGRGSSWLLLGGWWLWGSSPLARTACRTWNSSSSRRKRGTWTGLCMLWACHCCWWCMQQPMVRWVKGVQLHTYACAAAGGCSCLCGSLKPLAAGLPPMPPELGVGGCGWVCAPPPCA